MIHLPISVTLFTLLSQITAQTQVCGNVIGNVINCFCPAGTSKPQWLVCSNGSCSGTFDPKAPCKACSPGTYSGSSNSFECTDCPRNTYAQNSGSTNCTACTAGYTTSGLTSQTSNSCVICPIAQYVSNGYCVRCPSGTYNSVAGSTRCQSCPIGYILSGPQTSISSCKLDIGMIVGVVVGVSLFIISCAIFYYRNLRKEPAHQTQQSRIVSSTSQGTQNTRNNQVVNRVQSTPLPPIDALPRYEARSDIANTQGVYQFNYPQPIVAVQETHAFDFNNRQSRSLLNAAEFTAHESHVVDSNNRVVESHVVDSNSRVVESHLDANIGFSSQFQAPKAPEFETYKSFYD